LHRFIRLFAGFGLFKAKVPRIRAAFWQFAPVVASLWASFMAASVERLSRRCLALTFRFHQHAYALSCYNPGFYLAFGALSTLHPTGK
jgi:hypothetical protein